MPGRKRRRIVSQAQRKKLHAMEGRGEISRKDVADMESRSASKLPRYSRSKGARKGRRRRRSPSGR
jgi:hypothetical protein